MSLKRLIVCCALPLIGCGPKPLATEPAIVAVTPVGQASGPVAQAMIPPSGGSVQSADRRLKVAVPGGALSAAQLITIAPISNETPGGKGLAYRLGPEGQTFSAPVKLTFSYANVDIAGSEPLALKIAYQDKQGRWNAIKNVVRDEAARTITVETTHFSDWSMLIGWQLRPPVAMVAGGQSVDLTVVTCNAKEAGSDELAELVYTCVPEPDFFAVEGWAVNGIAGGSAAVGMVASANAGTAQYVAPNVSPQKNPISVEATAKDKSGRKTLLIASIWVDAHPTLTGTITNTQVQLSNLGDTLTTTANVTFKYDTERKIYLSTEGTLTARIDIVTSVCEQHYAFTGPIPPGEGTILVDEGNYYPDGTSILALDGTSSCTSSGMPTSVTINAGVYWWPAPASLYLPIKPDGRLEDAISEEEIDGVRIAANWSLVPAN